MTANSFTIFDWISFARIPFVIVHHIYCIRYALRKKEVSPIVKVVLVIFGLDLFDLIPDSLHDFLAILLDKEIYPEFLLYYIGFTQCFRWYGILSLVCYMAFLHLWSIHDISRFRKLPEKTFTISIFGILVFSAAVCVPLVTPFAGFIYNSAYHYWSFDPLKPGFDLYSWWNWISQGICLFSIISADLYVIYFLQKHRQRRNISKSVSSNTATIETSRPSLRTVTGAGDFTPVVKPQKKKPRNGERSLAFCFMFFSFCFILATVSFNFLGGLNSHLVKIIQTVAKWLEYLKFTPYILVLRG